MTWKILASVLVAVLLWQADLLREIATVGMPGAAVVIVVFLALVAVYCRCLQRTLQLLDKPSAGVWLMFAIPYNFVEDFFIVRNVGAAMRDEPRLGARFVRLWTILGLGWCAWQIVSLLPGVVGLVGGAVAIPLWAAHWIMTVRANRILAGVSRAASAL